MSAPIDWNNIGFAYRPLKSRYEAVYKNGVWGEGYLTDDPNLHINECAVMMQYCQQCFEGLKAYTTADGRVVMFRPDRNARRMQDSCARLLMPAFPEERFLEAADRLVLDNIESVPPYGTGASLYIRPFMIGVNPEIGVLPAREFIFRMFATPVGAYFKGGMTPIRLTVCDYDRAAPAGTGHVKAGLNYAMSLYATQAAHEQGFAENLYLDPMTRTRVEETGGSNIFFVTKEKKIVTPRSGSILPSITRLSVLEVARRLGYETEEREILMSEVDSFAECGLCGTAAVISPVGAIFDHGREIVFPGGMREPGPVCRQLYETLTGIQLGTAPAPEGWIRTMR